MNRFKNVGVWTSIASLILLILQNAGVSIVADQYNAIVNTVLGILVTLGILSNPTAGKGYIDK